MNNIEGLSIMQNIYYDCPFCKENVIISHIFKKEDMIENKLDKNFINKIIEIQVQNNRIIIPYTKENNVKLFKCFLKDNRQLIWKYLHNSFAKTYLVPNTYKELCLNECCNDFSVSDSEDEDTDTDEETEEGNEYTDESDLDNNENEHENEHNNDNNNNNNDNIN
jgi:hypothetical protein